MQCQAVSKSARPSTSNQSAAAVETRTRPPSPRAREPRPAANCDCTTTKWIKKNLDFSSLSCMFTACLRKTEALPNLFVWRAMNIRASQGAGPKMAHQQLQHAKFLCGFVTNRSAEFSLQAICHNLPTFRHQCRRQRRRRQLCRCLPAARRDKKKNKKLNKTPQPLLRSSRLRVVRVFVLFVFPPSQRRRRWSIGSF